MPRRLALGGLDPHAMVRVGARARQKVLALEIGEERQRVLQPDVEQPCGLRWSHNESRKFEKRIAETEGVDRWDRRV